jgi:hypothetical protein
MRHAAFTILLLVTIPAVAAPPPVGKRWPTVVGWGEFVDPDGDCMAVVEKDVLTLTAPKTRHDLSYNADGTWTNAPRVVRAVDGDFTVSVVVKAFPVPKNADPSAGRHRFTSAGFVVWQDDKTFFRFERAGLERAADSPPYIHNEFFTDGKSKNGKSTKLGDTDTGLRIVRKGDTFTLSVDDGGEGKNWKELRTRRTSQAPDPSPRGEALCRIV